MRKKIFSLVTLLMLLVSLSTTKLFSKDSILGETLVNIYTYVEDLPEQFVKGSEIPKYEYGGEEVYDFRHYFEIYDNAEVILNMHNIGGEIDLGGYVWETDFDIDVVGVYTVTLNYDGVNGLRTNSIQLEVIEEDVEKPEIFMIDRNFNIVRKEDEEDFIKEFDRFIYSIRVYDKVDGVLEVSIDDFDQTQIEELRNANLRDKVSMTLNIKDNANNESSKTITLTVVDLRAPNIHNIKTVTTKKGKRINYTNHLDFTDNYTERENIQRTYTIYKTLVEKNIWELGDRRKSQSEGKEIKNLINLTENGIDAFIEHLEGNYPTVHNIGDYYEIVDEAETTFVIINDKVLDGEGNLINQWESSSTKDRAKGKRLESFIITDKSRVQLKEAIESEHETGLKVNDYYRVLDLETDKRYYVYIKEKENELRDEQQTINFNEAGVQYVRIEAMDEFGNKAQATYRVVVEDGITFMQGILIVNGIVFAVAGIGVLVYYITRKRK